MKINVGVNEDDSKIMFVTDDNENNIGELDISESYYHHSLKELGGEGYQTGLISDGYHTFNELYYHRMILFSVICNSHPEKAWKSWKHHDGTMYDDYFIVGLNSPEGQYSYHYHKSEWDYFKVKELEFAPGWDGHQPKDITRLLSLI